MILCFIGVLFTKVIFLHIKVGLSYDNALYTYELSLMVISPLRGVYPE